MDLSYLFLRRLEPSSSPCRHGEQITVLQAQEEPLKEQLRALRSANAEKTIEIYRLQAADTEKSEQIEQLQQGDREHAQAIQGLDEVCASKWLQVAALNELTERHTAEVPRILLARSFFFRAMRCVVRSR